MKFTRISAGCLLLLAIVVLSCQKELSSSNILPRIEAADSTLLIKSISLTHYDSNGMPEDSITETYAYDTVNRKITVSWVATDDYELDGVTAVFSYNAKDLLTGVRYSYPPGFPSWEYDIDSLVISYDNQDVLQQVRINYVMAPQELRNYTKTSNSPGYSLQWEEIIDPMEQYFLTAEFDASGNCLKQHVEFPLTDPGGNVVTAFTRDSLIYDGGGSLQKIFTKQGREGIVLDEYQVCDFGTRMSKGSQLYDQRLLLLNGLDKMPFGDYDSWFELSILSFSPDPFEDEQFSKFPFQTAQVRKVFDNNTVPFSSHPVFDSKDRLVEFTGFFNDLGLEPKVYKISYYK